MSERLFGSDGARGPVDIDGGPGRISQETFEGLAYAYAGLTRERSDEQPVFIIGGDTRPSTPQLVDAACRGAAAAGARIIEIGIAPTPAIGWLAQYHGHNAIAITASHNPAQDNGFKPFEAGGVKPDRDTLIEIEDRYWAVTSSGLALPAYDSGRIQSMPGMTDSYIEAVVERLGGKGQLEGRSLLVDGANGAASELAPKMYKALGANVIRFACNPTGVINKDSGAAHLEGVQAFMAEAPLMAEIKHFLGAFSNDGDADRVMGVSAAGDIINGNHWMQMLSEGQRGIVGTLYTNSALRRSVRQAGVEFHESDNGDSNVTALLHGLTAERGEGYTRGGEFTGHMIDTTYLPSGDGLYMGGLMAVNLAGQGQTLQTVYDAMPLWPEEMRSVRLNAPNGKSIVARDEVQAAAAEINERYGDAARLILRASGTEPLVRIWAEAEDRTDAIAIVNSLERIIVPFVRAR